MGVVMPNSGLLRGINEPMYKITEHRAQPIITIEQMVFLTSGRFQVK